MNYCATPSRTNPPTVHGSGKVVTINIGQILIFHSNFIHCGGMSCQKAGNFLKVSDRLMVIDKLNTEQIKWFGSGKSAKDYVITDILLHHTVDALSGQMTEGDFSTGTIEIFIPNWESNADRVYTDTLKRSLMDYQDMRLPGRVNVRKPCGSIILDVGMVLGLYLNEDYCTPSKRKSGRISKFCSFKLMKK